MASVPVWRHRIPVGHGVTTPGTEDTEAELRRLQIPDSLAGRRVLDVGCSDGFYSFVCEQRGARVTAIDDESSMLAGEGRRNGFETAAALRQSTVDYRVADVHNLAGSGIEEGFDVILFVNVLYHLENPVLALRQLADVAAPGATLILKTYYRTDVRLWLRGRCLGFDLSSRPKWWFFPGTELGGDPTNWWAPNRPALGALLTATGWSWRFTGRWRDRQYLHATRTA
ncbi:MAG: class I SAM-dependent methyltransferase [Acidimicrobiales bacterium]